jgi:chemotaxis protein histidine kinase CheA
LDGASASNSITSLLANLLSNTGITIQNGLTTIKNLAVTTFSAKTARIDHIEMVDSATGDIYCTWIENGEWKRVKGDCSSVGTASLTSNLPATETSASLEETVTEQTKEIVEQATQVVEHAQQVSETAQEAVEQSQQAADQAQQAADEAAEKAVQKVEDKLNKKVKEEEEQPDEVAPEEPVEIESQPEAPVEEPIVEEPVQNQLEEQPVQEAPVIEEQVPEIDVAPVAELIEEAASGLLNGMIKFIKNFFSFTSQKISSSGIGDKISAGLTTTTPSIMQAQTASVLDTIKVLLNKITIIRK